MILNHVFKGIPVSLDQLLDLLHHANTYGFKYTDSLSVLETLYDHYSITPYQYELLEQLTTE